MKVLSLILFLGIIIAHATCEEEAAVEDPCAESTNDDCVYTEYDAYLKCIEKAKSKRIKRQAQCPYVINAQQPVQQALYYPAQQQVVQSPAVAPCNVLPCQPQSIIVGSHTNVIPNQIRTDMPIQEVINSDVELITENHDGKRQIIVNTGNGDTPVKYSSSVPGHNITTVINLNNIINNTNIIDSPTDINNTNINNIHIYQNKTSTTGGKFGLGYTEKGSCCFSVRPKTCRKTSNGPKCHHHRHKTCGSQCTSRVMHTQVRRRCQSHGECNRRTVHIPQPPPPRCVSTYYWPYTSCGGYQSSSCDGCYDHYGYGYENYYGGHDNSRCNGCYDDGYEQGPLYRRGPVLRPTHYHEPPCDLTGSCDGDHYSNRNGYFGHDRIDPAFHEDDYEYFEGDARDFKRVFNITDINDSGEDDNDEESGDYAIQSRKCRIVEEANGSIIIRNCTLEDLENQYAGSPKSQRNDESERRNIRRSSASYYNYPPPPPPYYYPPPAYMSPYMAPPPPPMQYRQPPRPYRRRPHRYENDDDDEEQNDDDYNDYDIEVDYRPRVKHVAKKHHKQRENRFPIDEEDLDSFKNDDREFDVYNIDD